MMAQNCPELFDGIVAGAPSNFYPDLLMWLLWAGRQQVSSFSCETPWLQARTTVPGDILQIQNALRQRALILPKR